MHKNKLPIIPSLFENDEVVSDYINKTEIFNNYFATQCTSLENVSALPPFISKTQHNSFHCVLYNEAKEIIRSLDTFSLLCLIAASYWSAWSDWDFCSVTCGVGVRTKIRECINMDTTKGASCKTSYGSMKTFETISRSCESKSCPGMRERSYKILQRVVTDFLGGRSI